MRVVNLYKEINVYIKKNSPVKNKRPRGLDTLLGHMLVKRVPIMYKLSSTKIPEYLSQSWIQGRQKLETNMAYLA